MADRQTKKRRDIPDGSHCDTDSEAHVSKVRQPSQYRQGIRL